jgi:hypothetical protein
MRPGRDLISMDDRRVRTYPSTTSTSGSPVADESFRLRTSRSTPSSSTPVSREYLTDGRALRIETVINSPNDLRCQRRLRNLDELQAKARDVNARLLDTERVGQGCVLASPACERVARSSVNAEGRRAPALRFGDPRVMALLGALCVSLNALGFTSRSLRAQVSRLLGRYLHPTR